MSKVHNDYFLCYFNNDPAQLIRKDLHDKWDIHWNVAPPVGKLTTTLKQETLRTCEMIYEVYKQYTPKLNFFFSGGTDSECFLKCLHQLKIPVNPIIVTHYYTPKSEEAINAHKICKALSLEPTVIDINLHELYKNRTFHDMGLKYQSARVGRLEMIYALEQIQQPCVLADEVLLVYMHDPNELLTRNAQPKWFFQVLEDEDGIFDRYQHLSGIPTIADSFRYTPQNWAALVLAKHIKDIVFNNKGKMSSASTKNAMMSKEFSVPFRDKTNVFTTGPHKYVVNQLINDLASELLPHSTVTIEYHKLLKTLGVEDYAV